MKIKTIIAYLAIYIIWGSTYYAIRLGVQTIPPFYVVGLRFFIGGILLFILLMTTGQFPKKATLQRRQFGWSAFLGVLMLIGGNGLVTIAEKNVDSYIAALIVSATPFMVLIIDRILFKKPIKKMAIASIALGFLGVAVLLYDGHRLIPTIRAGEALILLAVFLWATGMSLAKHKPILQSNLLNNTVQMIAAGTVALSAAALLYPACDIAVWSFTSILATAYLAVLGTAGLLAFGYLMQVEPLDRVATYAFVNPLIAVLLGVVIGHEAAVPYLVPAMMLILAALTLMFYGYKLKPLSLRILSLVKKRPASA